MKGYKAFNPDWTCVNNTQYVCPGEFTVDGELVLGRHGIHFCKTVVACFNYYNFYKDIHVAEIEAVGDVISSEVQSIYCTNHIKIIRELSREEIDAACNTGEDNKGYGNSGSQNYGAYNSGDNNHGNYNTGNHNYGDQNTGIQNRGDHNTGNHNEGAFNVGNFNIGSFNNGSRNQGEYNNGNNNKGLHNMGSWNNGEYNLGVFNTGKKDQKIYMFNKLSDWTMEDWILSDAWEILQSAPFTDWILLKNINEDDLEKDEYAHVRTTLGKLTKRPEEEMQIWWDSLPQKSKNAIYSLPNFDAKVFKECVGIDVNKKP